MTGNFFSENPRIFPVLFVAIVGGTPVVSPKDLSSKQMIFSSTPSPLKRGQNKCWQKLLLFLTKKTSATIRILKIISVIISFANLKTSRGQTYHVFQGGIMTPSYPERQHKQTKKQANTEDWQGKYKQKLTLKNARISGDNLSKQHFLNILKMTKKLSRPYPLFLCFEVRKW